MKKRYLSLIICAIIVIASTPINSVYKIKATAISDNWHWSINSNGSILTISGTGDMDNFRCVDDDKTTPLPPWINYKNTLQTVIIEEGITSIGSGAFKNFSINEVNIPNTVTSIGNGAFYNNWFTSIIIPESVSTIGWEAFYSCYLNDIILPNSVEYLGFGAFENCYNLQSITLSDKLKAINGRTFYGCGALKTITIPNNIKEIGDRAFQNCISISSFIMPEGIDKIGISVFEGCSSLESITTTGLNRYMFKDCSKLSNVTFVKFQNIYSREIPEEAFYNCKSLTSMTIPDKATAIGDKAFYNCSELAKIIIPKNIETIGDQAFFGCKKLNDVYYWGSEEEFFFPSWNDTKRMHYYTEVAPEEPTCANGLTAYSYWSNTNPVEYIVEPTIVEGSGQHTPDSAITENEISASCTADSRYDSVVYCSVCGEEISRETVIVPLTATGHSFTNYVSDNNATCLADGTKTAKCDNCEETDTIADEGSALGHALIHHTGKPSTCKEKGYTDYDTCSRCDYTTYSELPLADHTPAPAVRENIIAATCTENGSYDSVVYCSVCGEELSRETLTENAIGHSFTNYVSDNNATCLADGTKTAKCDNCEETDTIADEGSALGHALIHHTGKASTCKEKGYADYDTCSRCDYTTYSELPLADHIPAPAVRENIIAATCTEDGSYDSVIYCSVCGEELSRETLTETANGHSFTNYVSDNNATCLQDGTKTAKCDNCDKTDTIADEGSALGHNIVHHTGKLSTCKEKGYADYDTCSRCDYTTYSELPLADHAPATAVKENTVAATCTENGSYDSVVYCSVCGKELSRKTETTAKTGHKDKNNDGVCDICGTVTDTAKHNAYLLGKAKINVKSSATVDYRSTVTVTATANGLPEGYVLALYEGSTLKAKGSATSVSYNAGELMGNKTFTVKVVNSGNTPQKDSSGKEVNKTVEVKVKSGFFDKLIAFFRNLFGSLPKVEIKP